MDFFPCPIRISNVRNDTLASLFNYTALDWSKTFFSVLLTHQRRNTKNTKNHDGHHDLQPKCDQGDQFAVVDLSVGNKDLQQCADVIMRIRAEYFYAMKHFDRIKFTRSCDADS